MKVMHYTEAKTHNIGGSVTTGKIGRVLIGKDDGARNFCMRMFELAQGTTSPQHSHEWEHEMFIHSGKGEVFCDGSWLPVETGSAIFIPGNEVHQLRNSSDKPLVFICLIPSGPPEM